MFFHAEPRYTKDLDILVEPTTANAAKTWRALASFGAPLKGLRAADFAEPGSVYMMGIPQNRIDVITSITSIDFADAWSRRKRGRFGDEPAHFLGLDDLIRNKRAVGRPQDITDVRKLEAARVAIAKRRPKPSK